jgi:hypothetical protein
MSKKTLEDNFSDWESSTFGFGYGTGEDYTVPALRNFMLATLVNTNGGRAYDYRVIENSIGAATAWLLINALCKVDIIEYGSSPRFGWLTEKGEALRNFMLSKPEKDLIGLTARGGNYIPCYPSHCNCEEGMECANPFWSKK